jgi:hypothetical protein
MGEARLGIIGEEEEVVRAAVMHAMDVYGHGRPLGRKVGSANR